MIKIRRPCKEYSVHLLPGRRTIRIGKYRRHCFSIFYEEDQRLDVLRSFDTYREAKAEAEERIAKERPTGRLGKAWWWVRGYRWRT